MTVGMCFVWLHRRPRRAAKLAMLGPRHAQRAVTGRLCCLLVSAEHSASVLDGSRLAMTCMGAMCLLQGNRRCVASGVCLLDCQFWVLGKLSGSRDGAGGLQRAGASCG